MYMDPQRYVDAVKLYTLSQKCGLLLVIKNTDNEDRTAKFEIRHENCVLMCDLDADEVLFWLSGYNTRMEETNG